MYTLQYTNGDSRASLSVGRIEDLQDIAFRIKDSCKSGQLLMNATSSCGSPVDPFTGRYLCVPKTFKFELDEDCEEEQCQPA